VHSFLLSLVLLVPVSGGAPRPDSPGVPPRAPDERLAWRAWWDCNAPELLRLKRHVHEAGGDEGCFFLHGQGDPFRLRPTEEQVRQKVVPALLAVLAEDRSSQLSAACLVALGSTGVEESSGERLATVLSTYLAETDADLRETAALALGLLASPDALPPLEARLRGGARAGNQRERAFAALALGLAGERTGDEAVRAEVVRELLAAFDAAPRASEDLRVACLSSLGLVPSTSLGGDALELLARVLHHRGEDECLRATAAAGLARLAVRGAAAGVSEWKPRAIDVLLRDLHAAPGTVALALGGLAAGEERVLRALVDLARTHRDARVRGSAWIGLGQEAAAHAAEAPERLRAAAGLLVRALERGAAVERPFAALAAGRLAGALADMPGAEGPCKTLRAALRSALELEPDREAAAPFALACGLARDPRALPLLRARLESRSAADGFVALALGLAGDRDSIPELQALTERARYRPLVLRDAARGLALLGDKEILPRLHERLGEAKGLATHAALLAALGEVGDQRAVDPLVVWAQDERRTLTSRGFAVVALGNVAARDSLPWTAALAHGLDPAEMPPLFRSANGTGLLDGD